MDSKKVAELLTISEADSSVSLESLRRLYDMSPFWSGWEKISCDESKDQLIGIDVVKLAREWAEDHYQSFSVSGVEKERKVDIIAPEDNPDNYGKVDELLYSQIGGPIRD